MPASTSIEFRFSGRAGPLKKQSVRIASLPSKHSRRHAGHPAQSEVVVVTVLIDLNLKTWPFDQVDGDTGLQTI